MIKKIDASIVVLLGCDTDGCQSEVSVGICIKDVGRALTGTNTLNHAIASVAVKQASPLGFTPR